MSKLSQIKQFKKDTKTINDSKIIEVTISNIDGQGRGSIWFNTDTPMTFPNGSVMIWYNGQDDDEDEGWDDFGSQYYQMGLKGTKSQILEFLDNEYELITGKKLEIEITE